LAVYRTSVYRERPDVDFFVAPAKEAGSPVRFVHACLRRHLFRFELEHLLARAGFDVEHIYANHDMAAYGSIYPGERVVVARNAP
jgi:hypothetical protein